MDDSEENDRNGESLASMLDERKETAEPVANDEREGAVPEPHQKDSGS